MKRNILIGLLVLTLAAFLAAGGTTAWFSAKAGPVTNYLTAGTVDIEVIEDYTPVTGWQPGETKDKEVSVEAIGSKRVYVRVALTPVWGYVDDNDVFHPEPSLPIDNVTLNLNSQDWVYQDGWYYYTKILSNNQKTSTLLNSVTLAEDTDPRYQGKALQILVNAEAVQASHEAYKDVWGLENLPSGVEPWTG